MGKIILGQRPSNLRNNMRSARRGADPDMTRIADVIVPEIFTNYTQLRTKLKSAIIQSGAAVIDPRLNAALAGAGLTFNEPFFKDLERDEENVSSDTGPDSKPGKITTAMETQIRLSRNKSWGSADLVSALIDTDPMSAIGNLVGDYWTDRFQVAFISTMKGVYANNDLVDDDYHEQGDMSHDVSGDAFENNKTNFSPSAFINATGTMGDAMQDLTMIMVHSVVYQRMQLLNLIDFIPDARGEIDIPVYMGRRVIVDDSMPNDGKGKFESWLFRRGAVGLGMGSPKVPTAVTRKEEANQGGGEEVLHNRVEWIIHPVGYKYIGTTDQKGGPSNSAETGMLANGNTWRRAFNERKQIPMARLITREF